MLLNIYYTAGTLLGTRAIASNKTDQAPALVQLRSTETDKLDFQE